MSTSNSSLLNPRCILITGGCGFIGVNLLDFLLKKGLSDFRILDNLSVGQVEDLESVLSEHGKYEKKEEGNHITYSLSKKDSSLLTSHSLLSKDSSLLTKPREIHGNEEQSGFHQGPNFHPAKSLPRETLKCFTGAEGHLTRASRLTPDSSLKNDSLLLTSDSPLKGVAGETFQIATFKETTVSEISKKIRKLVEKETGEPVDIIHTENRLGDAQRNYSDISKAMKLLKFRPVYELDTGLSETCKAFL
ncbi:MAG: hypothetical protein HWN68_04650 [Desulfobacterales bacterium]|nr:hypothetical protein [Desulfobacterales bacterium]